MLSLTRPLADAADRLRHAAAEFMQIEDTTLGEGSDRFAVRFRGRLTMDPPRAYELAAAAFKPLGFTPLFRMDEDRHSVLAVSGVIEPPVSRAWINYLMMGLTIMSVLYTGALYVSQSLEPLPGQGWPAFLQSGWKFVLSMLGILLAHELGHYFAARYHKVAVTLPYFIPFPGSPFGTLGAFIQLKSPPTNRRVLLDIGMAGPIAGLLVAVPVLLYGLYTSPLMEVPLSVPAPGMSFEGNSILYVLSKFAVFGRLLPEHGDYGGLPPLLHTLRYYLLGFPAPLGGLDVQLNEVAWAGWAGLLVTGLNLIPAGQLDGGHALYVLLGRNARRVLPAIIVILVGLGFFWPGWFLWAAIVFFTGRAHAEPLDQITSLDGRRRLLAVAALVLFVLVITPVPLINVAR